MSGPTRNEIRDMLERVVSDSPAPHPWGDIERRAAAHDAPPSQTPRRTAIWLAAAACTIALVAGFVVLIDNGDDVRIDEEPTPTTLATTVPETTAGPTTSDAATTTSSTTPDEQLGWTGGLLDDLDADSFQPLSSVAQDDLVVPTAPEGWRLLQLEHGTSAPLANPLQSEWSGSGATVIEARPDGATGGQIEVTLSKAGSDEAICAQLNGSEAPCPMSDTSVQINGLDWQPFIELDAVRASTNDLWIEVQVQGLNLQGPVLDDPRVIAFLEGLRVAPTDDQEQIFEEIGQACWACGDRGFSAGPEPTSLGDIDTAGLRPLSTLSAGDVVIPTAPPGWGLWAGTEGGIKISESPDGQVQELSLLSGDGEFLRMVVAPCDSTRRCYISVLQSAVHLPPVDTIEVGGNTWGYNLNGDPFTVIGDHVVVIAVDPFIFSRRDGTLLEDPEVLELIGGLRVTPLDDVPDHIVLIGQRDETVDRTTVPPAATATATVASYELGETTMLLNAAPGPNEVCFALDRADTGETIEWSGCHERSEFEQNLTLFVAELWGPAYGASAPGVQRILAGYVNSPTSVDVRATYDDASVEGRSARPNHIADGVFVLMPVTEIWDPSNYEGSYLTHPVQIEIIEPAD